MLLAVWGEPYVVMLVPGIQSGPAACSARARPAVLLLRPDNMFLAGQISPSGTEEHLRATGSAAPTSGHKTLGCLDGGEGAGTLRAVTGTETEQGLLTRSGFKIKRAGRWTAGGKPTFFSILFWYNEELLVLVSRVKQSQGSHVPVTTPVFEHQAVDVVVKHASQ